MHTENKKELALEVIRPVVLPFDVGEFLRHVPACEVKQEGRHGVVAVCSLEIGYKEVPADDGLHPHGEVADNPHLVLVREILLALAILAIVTARAEEVFQTVTHEFLEIPWSPAM